MFIAIPLNTSSMAQMPELIYTHMRVWLCRLIFFIQVLDTADSIDRTAKDASLAVAKLEEDSRADDALWSDLCALVAPDEVALPAAAA